PFVTGTSAGATLAAVVAIVLGLAAPFVPIAAFAGALITVTLVWRLARLGGGTTVLTVLLAGVVLTSFAGAVVTFLLVSSDRLALQLRAVLGWLQGGVSVISWPELGVAALVVALGLGFALVLAHRVDAYAFGEETAATLGVDPDRTTTAVLGATALLSGAAVALAGLVGLVGLVIPHALRFVIGATHRRLVPASFLAGLLRPKVGSVSLDGQDLASVSRSQVARRIAVVPQIFDTLFPFTVREVVALGRTARLGAFGRASADDVAAVERAIDELELGALAGRRIDRLSGGERQRAVLAMALAQETAVLLLDEPTVHLDPGHQPATLELLRELARRRQLAVGAVLHDLNLASA